MPRPDTMLQALAWAARSARRSCGGRRHEMAIAAGVSPITVERFERAERWPRQVEEIVAVYAECAGVSPQEIWQAAINAWSERSEDEHG